MQVVGIDRMIERPPLLDAVGMDEDRMIEAPLLDLEPPPPPVQTSHWKRWGVCILYGCGAAASLILRLKYDSHWTNAIGSLGVGFCVQGGIHSSWKGDPLVARVRQFVLRQLSLTVFGIGTQFAFTQFFENEKGFVVQTAFVDAIIGLLGANIETVARWLWQEGAVRVWTHAHLKAPGERLKPCCDRLPQIGVEFAKLFVAGALGVLYSHLKGPKLKGLSSFASLFCGLHVVGGGLMSYVNHQLTKQIEENHHLGEEEGTSFVKKGTHYQKWATALVTMAYVGITLGFIPWTKEPQFIAVGGIFGFCQGILDRSIMARIKNTPIRLLEEFQKAFSQGKRSVLRCVSRIVRIAGPALSGAGLIGFSIWQFAYVLKDKNSQIALGSLLAGFLGHGICHFFVDWTWNPDVRHRVRDKLMYFFSTWTYPLFVYWAVTSALKMDSRAIEEQEKDNAYLAAVFVAWACYGYAWAREVCVTSSERMGSLLIKWPAMAIINGAITFRFGATGAFGVKA